VPFGFLKGRKPEVRQRPVPVSDPEPADDSPAAVHIGPRRGVPFTALTEDWRLAGRMEISGRLSDALNRREPIAITDVQWGPADGSAPMEPASGLRNVDPYDLILVIAGAESLPPLTEPERAALKVHKVACDVALEVPPFRVVGTIYLRPGADPERLLDRATDMFMPVVDAVARLGETDVSDPQVDAILVNRSYLRGVEQVDKRTGQRPPELPGASMAGVSGQLRSP
jgi:hypothetical protein